jgi:hypothetical protein
MVDREQFESYAVSGSLTTENTEDTETDGEEGFRIESGATLPFPASMSPVLLTSNLFASREGSPVERLRVSGSRLQTSVLAKAQLAPPTGARSLTPVEIAGALPAN